MQITEPNIWYLVPIKVVMENEHTIIIIMLVVNLHLTCNFTCTGKSLYLYHLIKVDDICPEFRMSSFFVVDLYQINLEEQYLLIGLITEIFLVIVVPYRQEFAVLSSLFCT